jgi:hypothetical protein
MLGDLLCTVDGMDVKGIAAGLLLSSLSSAPSVVCMPSLPADLCLPRPSRHVRAYSRASRQ